MSARYSELHETEIFHLENIFSSCNWFWNVLNLWSFEIFKYSRDWTKYFVETADPIDSKLVRLDSAIYWDECVLTHTNRDNIFHSEKIDR